MPLVDQPFAATFDFARARAAAYRNAEGALVQAAIDAPRFDHSPSGAPRGLLIEGRPQVSAADRLTVSTGDWSEKRGTVLHEYENAAGEVVRRAWYALHDPVSAVNACLNAKGRHRRIAFCPVFIPNRGGWIRWNNLRWDLGGLVEAEPGGVVAATETFILLEG